MRKPQELTAILAQIEREMVEYLEEACRHKVTIPKLLGDYLLGQGLVEEIVPWRGHSYTLLDAIRAYTATPKGRRVYASYERQRHRKTSS